MKRLLIAGLASLTLFPLSGRGTVPFVHITGTVGLQPPMIDAVSVLNDGTWNIFHYPYPYSTSNTRNFTNRATMYSYAVGFRFDNAGSSQRRMAANFHNSGAGATITADSLGAGLGTLTPAYLLVSATNIINDGLLTVSANGTMELTGTNINLRNSRLQVLPNSGVGSYNGTNSFDPDAGIYDNYWGWTNQQFDSSAIYQIAGGNVTAGSPTHRVQFPGGFFGTARVGPFSAVTACYSNIAGGLTLTVTNQNGTTTNVFVPTNMVRQAAFVGPAANMGVQIRFSDSTNPTNAMKTVSAELSVALTNYVTGGNDLMTIYLVDTLASETNGGVLPNSSGTFTARPANYLVSRLTPYLFFVGRSGNAVLTTNFFYDSTFTNRTVEGRYSGYSAFIDNLVSQIPAVPGGNITNLPGRITVKANSLDMTKARFRGEGLITIEARHLQSSSNAIVDGQNLSYVLGSTNGNLAIQNLALATVARLNGNIYAWSAVWSNSAVVVTPNYVIDTNTGIATYTPITNYAQYNFHALLFDGSALQSSLPVSVHDFTTRSSSTNVVIKDTMTVAKSLLIDGTSFTLEGSLTLGGVLQDWAAGSAPNLRFFTNTGTLSVPNDAHFGDDRATPYAAFVNRGTITAFSQTINSDYAEIGGVSSAQGPFTLFTRSGKLENGQVNSGGDMRLEGNILKLNNCILGVGSRLDLTFTNSLFDAGGGASNSVTCSDGFRLNLKPQTGDLLGTTFRSVAPNYPSVEVDHTWAGTDRGATAAGYSDNAAIGKLVLSSLSGDPLFLFAGAATQQALYVDQLDISGLGAGYQSQIAIDPSLVIYFASAKLGFTPPSPLGPEEYLDGQFDGRLRWVSSFAGPNSSMTVLSNGVSILINRALRNSKVIDSNGNGLPNYYDPNPFDVSAPALTASLVETNLPPTTAVAVSWLAAPNTVYQVEFTTNMPPANWQPLLKYTNNVSTNRIVAVWDTNAPTGSTRRFYRVGYSP